MLVRTLVAHFHPVSIFQRNTVAEAQRMSSEEVHMHVARLTVSFKLEMMMLQIEAVTRCCPRRLLQPSTRLSSPFSSMRTSPTNRLKSDTHHEFRTEAARTQF